MLESFDLGLRPPFDGERSAPPALGYVEAIVPAPDGVVVGGWIILRDDAVDTITWRTTDGQEGATEVLDRPDVASLLPALDSARRTGFVITLEGPGGRELPTIEICAHGSNGTSGQIISPISAELSTIPVPPQPLTHRVAHTVSPEVFRATGLKVYGDLVAAVNRHGSWDRVTTLLDWGCGSGRTTRFFLDSPYALSIHGCDVDAEAITWLEENTDHGTFDAIDPMPPTHYPDQKFDVVVSYSVLTHLDRATQAAWLAEVARVLRPGGLFVASVHGEFAAGWSGVDLDELAAEGILDATLDPTLDGITPDAYYRSTYQSTPYTRDSFAPHFEVLDVDVAGAGSFQDLITARRHGAAAG